MRGWAAQRLHPFPEPSRLDHPSVTLDATVRFEGQRSLKIACPDPKDMVILVRQAVPVQPGGRYCLSCRVRNTGTTLWVRQDVHDREGRVMPDLYRKVLGSDGAHEWLRLEVKLALDERAASLGLSVFVGGQKPGVAWLDDLRLEPFEVTPEEAVLFRMTPNFYTDDNVFRLPQGAPMTVFLTAANAGGHKAVDPRFVVELPEGVEMVGGDYESDRMAEPARFEKEGRPYARHEHRLGLPGVVLQAPDFSRPAWGSVAVLLRTDLPPGPQVYDAWVRFRDGDLECRPCLFRLRVDPPIQKSRAPKLFRSAADTATSMEFYGSPLAAWAGFYKFVGFNEILLPRNLRAGALDRGRHSRSPKPCVQKMRDLGVEVTINEWRMTNGYRFRGLDSLRQAPDDVFLKRADGVVVRDALDPAYMRRRGDLFVKAVEEVLDSNLDLGGRRTWANWEPYMYSGAGGSFTDLSLEDFAAFAGLKADDIRGLKPADLLRLHKDRLTEFQSWQYAEAMKAIQEVVRGHNARTGRAMDLIPCVSRVTFEDPRPGMEHENYARCFQGKDYLRHLDAVSAWSYVFMDYRSFEDPQKKRLYDLGYRGPNADLNKTQFATLETVERLLDLLRRQRQRHGLDIIPYLHLTQNLQSASWVVLPEEIGLQMLAAFLGGAQGAYLYYFPMGYDGRYWRSAAEANDLIAEYEDFVCRGRRVTERFAVTPRTALFQHADYQANLACRAFERDGRRLIAVANFDFLDEAVLDLACRDLPAAEYVLWRPHRREHYVPADRPFLTPADLAQVTLDVPRMAVEFLVLEPRARDRDYGRPVRLDEAGSAALRKVADLDRRFAERLEAIAEARRPITEEPTPPQPPPRAEAAAPVPADASLPPDLRPKSVLIECGDLRVRFDSLKAWNMNRVEFKGTRLGVDNSGSHYGTVFSIPGLGFIGTGHREHETEAVERLAFYLDDRPVAGGWEATLRGGRFRVARESRIRDVRLATTIEVRDNRIHEAVTLTVDEEFRIALVYHFMHPWTPTATHYMAGGADQPEMAGEFTGDGKFCVEKEMEWVAVYDGPSGKGIVSRLIEKDAAGGGTMMIWDKPPVYRKFYLRCFRGGVLPAGIASTYRMTTGFFEAPAAGWQDAARRLADSLKPPAPPRATP
jgi:hypothetical protein